MFIKHFLYIKLRKRGFAFFLFYFHAKYLITLFYKIIKSKNKQLYNIKKLYNIN